MRMPTEMASGLQIMKTCSALQSSGIEVTLFNGTRFQTNPEMRRIDPFEYYDIRTTFQIRNVWFLDTQAVAKYLGPLLRPTRIVSNLLFPLTARLAMRKWRPSAVYTRQWLAARHLVSRNIPTIFEMHEADTPHFSKRAVTVVAKLTHSPALRSVVTISNGLKETLVESGAIANKVHVMPDAVDLANYATSVDSQTLRNQLGIAAGAFAAIYTGGAAPGKGVETIVEAAPLMPDVQFYIVGGQSHDLERITANTKPPSNLTFIPKVSPSVAARYQQASDVLLLPQISDQSQSPLKLYEYIAAGRPIVSTDIPPIREVLTHSRTALLAAPGSSEAFARQIKTIQENPELGNELTSAASSQLGDWSWERRGEKIAELIRAVV